MRTTNSLWYGEPELKFGGDGLMIELHLLSVCDYSDLDVSWRSQTINLWLDREYESSIHKDDSEHSILEWIYNVI